MRLFLSLFICLPLLASAQEISTKKVAVQALHLSKNIRPVILNHSFEPKRPERGVEPFSPKVQVKSYALPKGMAVEAVPVHWLTEFSGGLAATFLGSKGQFQRGQLAYKEKRYEDAKAAFAVLFKRKGGDIWEQTGLWQAWTLFQLEEIEASFEVASELFDAKDPSIRSEAYYIAGLQYYLSSKNKELFQLLKSAETEVPKESQSLRLHLLKLSALSRAEKWKEAHQALLALDIKTFERDPNYKKLVELEAVISYQASDFKNSLKAFITLERLQNDLGERLTSLKAIAWMNYFSGDYEKAKKTAHFVMAKLDLASQAEMHYLWIAAQVRLQRPQGLFAELKELPQSSDFYSFASFYIRSFFKELKQYPDLKNQVQASRFSFPELKFYTAILEGHRYFLNGDMASAEAEFLQALAVDSKSGLYWVAQYNMALVHMKAGKLEKGLGLLQELLKNREAPKHLIQYHQLFVHYNKKQDKEFLDLVPQVKQELLNNPSQWEVSLMHGALLYNSNKEKEALALFQKGWDQFKEPEALGYIAQVYYFRGKFNKVLTLAAEHPKPKSMGLIHWKVKSLLGLRKFERAKRVIEDARFKGDILVALHVEVWLNSKDFKKIISKVQPLLGREKDEATKIAYFGYLGDAWYNLKDYARAEVRYQDALKLAKGRDLRSNLHYNRVMSLYLANKFPDYEKAAEAALAEPLKEGTRFQITENYANYLQKGGKPDKAQALLGNYGRTYSFKKAQSQLQQVRLYKEGGSLEECSILAKSPVKGATAMEKRDLAILGAKCSIERGQSREVLATLENELLTGAGHYRKPEVTILLAQARNQVGGYAASQEMIDQLGPNTPKAYKLHAKLIKAENLFQMGQVAQSDKILGDPSQYHEAGIYPRALELQTQIKSQRGDLNQAVKNILRLYYKKGQSQEKKQAILFRLAKLYASKGKKTEALETLKKLNLSLMSPDLKPEYDKLQSQLAQN